MTEQVSSPVAAPTKPRKRVIVTVSGGGFFWQSRSVARALSQDFELHFVCAESVQAFEGGGLPDGEFHEVSRVTTMADRSPLRQITNLAKALVDTYRVIRNVRPEAVICIATALALPLCFWAKVFGRRAVFVESITRVTTPSLTGRMLSRMHLCDRLYVQWPEAEKLYGGAIYRGSLL